MKQWVYRSLFVGLLLALSFSVTVAQDKTTNRQRAALTKILDAGAQTITVGDLLENEDFSGDNSWETFKDKDTNVRTVDGTYRMTLKGNLYTYGLDTQENADTVIEVETNQLSEDLNNEYGVICRGATDKAGAGYYFFISGDGYYSIYKGTSEKLDKLVDWTQSDAINQGQADNSLVVVCINDYLALYANGTLLTETNDSSYTSGFAGFAVGSSENSSIDVTFDNARLWDIGSDSSSVPPTTAAAELTDFGGKSEDTIAELESLSLIPSGSSLIFGENYAFFTGQGNWFTPLASNQPRTNIVLGGDLTFRIGNADELETCTLTSRIDTNSKGTAVTYLDVGLVNDGRVFILDKFSESADPNTAVGTETVDMSEEHNFVLLVVDDKANLFVDGKLQIQDFEVVKRPGTYGIALLGKGKNAKCEGRNIWAYQIPASTNGECTVNSTKNINKRGGPGTSFDSAGQLKAGVDAVVIGQAKGSDGLTWWELDDESWVREDVVTETGDCTSIPIVKR
ncbi:MAG: hypothetical protein ABI690_19975 [Chloroflexota bacterium]